MDDNFTPPSTPPPGPSPATPPPQQPPPLRQTPPPAFTQPVYVQAQRARSGRGWKIFGLLMLVLFLCSLVFNPFHFLAGLMKGEPLQVHHTTAPRLQEAWIKDNNSKNKIAVIPIEGVITSQSMGRAGNNMVDVVGEQFKRAADDKSVKAVILKVNSPGGEVLASDDIYNIIGRFQEKTGKPVVAAMGSLAASGGYYVSAPCQWIIANEMTITGSIGVIMHGYNFRGLMDKVGVRPEVFKSGKFKDMLSPDKREEDITQEERDMIQSMVNETFDKFKTIVSEGRAGAAKKNVSAAEFGRTLSENWQQYADGRILSGKEALQHGFIDELGNFDAAIARARKLAKIPDANLVEYQPLFDLGDLLSIFGQSSQSEARTLKIDVGFDTLKLQTGRLYFLCPLVLPR
jgi:protease-4